MNNIEVFPADKSCEQECATCPLARKNGEVTATTIHPDVQETFSFIEDAYKKRRTKYNLHTTSALHLFPTITHPKLIHMARFETGKEVRVNGNAKCFSDNIKTLLDNYGITPTVLGFSLVPQYPVISSDDIVVLESIMDEVLSWLFKREKTQLQVTIRSNLIKAEVFNTILPSVFEKDFTLLKKLVEKYVTFDEYLMRTSSNEQYLYAHLCKGKKDTNKIEVLNRVIAEKNKLVLPEDLRYQALQACPEDEKFGNFAITPEGVMFEHASTRINNVLLWVSHYDFCTSFAKAFSKPRFSLGRFSKNMIFQNIAMYEGIVMKEGKTKEHIKKSNMLKIFEDLRPSTFK